MSILSHLISLSSVIWSEEIDLSKVKLSEIVNLSLDPGLKNLDHSFLHCK
jgi:hypothetical protein